MAIYRCNGGNSVVVTTNKAITTTQVCNKKCENGGNLKSATCTCECLNPYKYSFIYSFISLHKS